MIVFRDQFRINGYSELILKQFNICENKNSDLENLFQ